MRFLPREIEQALDEIAEGIDPEQINFDPASSGLTETKLGPAVREAASLGGGGGGGNSGVKLLTSGTIDSAVDAFILALPSGYSSYQLVFTSFDIDETAAGYLTYAFGDEGVEGDFYKDDETFLGYNIAQQRWGSAFGNLGVPGENIGATEDGYGYLVQFLNANPDEQRSTQLVVEINPGSAAEYAHTSAKCSFRELSSAVIQVGVTEAVCVFNQEKTRMDAIRLCTAFDGGQITAGTYQLYGRPNP